MVVLCRILNELVSCYGMRGITWEKYMRTTKELMAYLRECAYYTVNRIVSIRFLRALNDIKIRRMMPVKFFFECKTRTAVC